MSSSRSRNFRRRSDYDDDDGGGSTTPAPTAAVSTSSSGKSQPSTLSRPKSSKPEPPKQLLSFAADEDEDGPTPSAISSRRPPARTPSSASLVGSSSVHKHSSAKDRSKTSSSLPTSLSSNLQPQAGEYTKERLMELQKNARQLGSLPRSQPPPPSIPLSLSEAAKSLKQEPASEAVILLKGLVKPLSPATASQPEEEEDDDMEIEGDGAKRAGNGSLPAIPDRATIDAIRAKRQKLQQPHHATPDYISLDDGIPRSLTSAGGSSDEEDNDFSERTVFLGSSLDKRPKKSVFESYEDRATVTVARASDGGLRNGVDEVDDDDEDDEDRKWEAEQLRKGIGRKIDEPSAQKVSNILNTSVPQQQHSLFSGIVRQPVMSSKSAPFGVSRSSEVISIPQQSEVATRELHAYINRLKESHKRTLDSLVKTDTNISDTLSEVTSLEKSLGAAGTKYVFMQEIRDFISVMCDFLSDKSYYIEELEEQMRKLHERRASAVFERRAADIADEANEVGAAVGAALSILKKGSGSAYVSAATAAAQATIAAARECANLPVELDEFGRDVNLQKRMDYTRRSEVRRQKKGQGESKRMESVGKDGIYEQIEGEVSTDESDSESNAYFSSRNELLQTAVDIFSDTSEEYSRLRIVKERFERWKKQYSDSYRDAYVSLSAPSIFAPYVRLELLKWDPLYEAAEFDDMEWCKLLFDYGLSETIGDSMHDDADDKLVPELVEKVALPILHHELGHCWDILSTKSTKNAVFATHMIGVYVAETKGFHELVAIVRNRLTEAVSNLDVPVWSNVVTASVPGAAQVAAYKFGTAVRLLRNICLWNNILVASILEKLALEDLMKEKLLPHIRSIMSNIHDAITRTERIVASLSGVWSGPKVTSPCSRKLQPLVDCVLELGSRLEKRQASGLSNEETIGLARRLKNMLVALNDYDRARALRKTFQLKEPL